MEHPARGGPSGLRSRSSCFLRPCVEPTNFYYAPRRPERTDAESILLLMLIDSVCDPAAALFASGRRVLKGGDVKCCRV
jgi:hypothetical protein